MATVHTAYGPGEIVESKTTRGRTEHRVAGIGFDVWVDEASLGLTRVADAWGANPGDNHPDDPSGPFSHLGDEDPNYDPHAVAQGDGYDYSTEGGPGGDYSGGPGPHPDDLNNYDPPAPEWQGDRPDYGMGYSPEVHRHEDMWSPEEMSGLKDRFAWAPMDTDNSVALPYDPTPQYPAIPGDTESTLQPIHQIDADERLSPADSISFEDRSDDESELEPTGPNFADRHSALGDPTPHQTGPHGLGPDDPEHFDYAHPDMVDHDDPRYQNNSAYQGGVEHEGSSVHDAFAFLIPLAEGLMGAGAGAAAGGAAEGAGASALGAGVARGVGSAGAHEMMGGGGDDQGGGQEPGKVDQAIDALSPGEGWGELQRGASLDTWLDGQDSQKHTGRQLDARYIDIEASADYHNDPVAQFRHDPIAYIARIGHVYDEPTSPEMEHYGNLIESNVQIREAAWKDVRAKAMRLRREGAVSVEDISPDRIYATVKGDHGVYDTMIVKGGAFGGFGGGHSITNWRCSCEWGRWAFKRQFTYVGRLCSHGYAAYMEMNSNHMKGQPRLPRQTRPYTKKRADALQNAPQRLVPELVVNSEDDAQQFLDVTKDEREHTGPEDVVSDEDIVHFARVMTACDDNRWPYPRELVAFLEHLGEDQTEEDWKVNDTGEAGPALDDIRDWADKPPSQDWGHMEERNDAIRDDIEQAREDGVDASQLVAFRTAAPNDESMFGGDYRPPAAAPSSPSGSREPEGSNPRSVDNISGQGTVENGINTPNHSDHDPGNVSTTPNASDAGGGSIFGPGAGGQAPAPSGMIGPGAGGGAAGQTQGPGLDYGPGASLFGPNGGGTPPAPSGMIGPGAQAPGGGGDAPGGGGGSAHDPTGGGNVQPGVGSGADGVSGDAIGQGNYKIQPGDTLSDIAQRSGYGGDYNSLAQQNGLADPNKINAGGSLKIGDPKASGGGGEAPATPAAPTATNDPATNAPGGPLNQNSGGLGADASAVTNPNNDLTNPGLTTPGAPAADPVDMSAIPGATGGGGGIETGAASNGPDSSSSSGGGAPLTDTSSENGGAGASNSPASAAAATNTPTQDAQRAASRSIFADQADYDEWVRYAYPDAKDHDHKPFNGSGNPGPLEIGTSEEYADKARKKADDVTDLGNHDLTTPMDEWQKQSATGGGIRRAGAGPRRHVEPVVVREQRPARGSHVPQTVEASMEAFGNFDPLAARRPEDFDDDVAGQHIAANTEGDIVAAFQRSAGAQAVMSNGPSGGGDGDFDIAGAAGAFLQRTAGRNYSLAEQHELIREGDIGGAGNLGSLQLAGTHYEDESKNSVGLW